MTEKEIRLHNKDQLLLTNLKNFKWQTIIIIQIIKKDNSGRIQNSKLKK